MDHKHRAPLPKAWGFPADSVAELTQRLLAAGEGATLAVFPYQDGELMRLRLRVTPGPVMGVDAITKAAESPDINESFPCPPFTGCPGGGGA